MGASFISDLDQVDPKYSKLFNVESEESYHILDQDIICTEYSPDAFAHLRKLDNHEIKDIKDSLAPDLAKNIQ